MIWAWVVRVGDAASQGINTTFLGGSANESVSGRSYREFELEGNPRWKRSYQLINAVFFWQDNHCKRAYDNDIAYGVFALNRAGFEVTYRGVTYEHRTEDFPSITHRVGSQHSVAAAWWTAHPHRGVSAGNEDQGAVRGTDRSAA